MNGKTCKKIALCSYYFLFPHMLCLHFCTFVFLAEVMIDEANALPDMIPRLSKKKKPVLDRFGRLVKSPDGRRTRMANKNKHGRAIVTHMGVEVEEEDDETEALFAEADRAREAAAAAKQRAARNVVPDI